MFGARAKRKTQLYGGLLVAGWISVSAAFPADPELHVILPVGVQRSADVTLQLHGKRLADAEALILSQPGLTVREITAKNGKHITARVTVADDAPLGEHQVRIRTATGVSPIATVQVTALPVIDEAEGNNQIETAQAIPLGVGVRGVVTNEDVDYYRVEASKGARITAEIAALRLGRGVFDPVVTILDEKRFELAVSDDSTLLRQDSLASVVAPADGVYFIRVREAAYGGSKTARYLLQVGQFPRPRVVHPAGARPGEAKTLLAIGDVSGPLDHEFTVPNEAAGRTPILVEDSGRITPSPVWLWVSDLPELAEEQLGEDAPEVPIAFNGMIAAEGETDRYRFVAKKGSALDIEVFARRIRSPLDAVISIRDAQGKWLAGNDDGGHLDSRLRFGPPADGTYELRIHDHLRRGGDTFVYRVEVRPVQPALDVQPVVYDRRRPQTRQAIVVPQGNRYAALWSVNRHNVSGEVTVAIEGLPPGVQAVVGPVANGINRVPVVFEADADAQRDAALATITPRLVRSEADVLVGRFDHKIPLVLGAPNRTVYYETRADRLPVAVTQPAPFEITVVQPKTPLIRHGSKALRVQVERAADFDGIVDLHTLWLPPGVGAARRVRVEKGVSAVDYPCNANGRARLGTWPIVIIARANVGGNVWTSALPIHLDVAEPLLSGKIQMAAVERGDRVSLVSEVTPTARFKGEGTVRLLGLPPHVAHEPQVISADTKQIVFELTTSGKTPVGKHRGLRCELRLKQGDEEIVQQFAHGGILRVDKPRQPVAKEAPAEPKPKKKAAEPEEKPLSRLEQLRRAAQAARE